MGSFLLKTYGLARQNLKKLFDAFIPYCEVLKKNIWVMLVNFFSASDSSSFLSFFSLFFIGLAGLLCKSTFLSALQDLLGYNFLLK
jgi:hypothetical protein